MKKTYLFSASAGCDRASGGRLAQLIHRRVPIMAVWKKPCLPRLSSDAEARRRTRSPGRGADPAPWGLV